MANPHAALSRARGAFLSKRSIDTAQAYLRATVTVLIDVGRKAESEEAAALARSARKMIEPADQVALAEAAWKILPGLAEGLEEAGRHEARLARLLLATRPDQRPLIKVLEALREPFLPGTELWVDSGAYHHAGVYIGGGKVVNVNQVKDLVGSLFKGRTLVKVRKQSLRSFKEGRKVKRGPSPHIFPPEKAVARALSKVGQSWKYDPLKNNCQHFSSWVVSNRRTSPEAKQIQAVFNKAVGALEKKAGKAGKAIAQTGKKAGKKLKKLFR